MNRPLEGVKVVDFTLFAAGPAAGRILAEWGADVIHVEPMTGDPLRKTGATMGAPIEEDLNPLWNFYNSNKKGLCVDLKAPEGTEIMDKLIAQSDVFITSYRTKALEKLGLDYDTLSKRYPGLVWGQINGFGDLGPDRDAPGFDVVAFWARSGALIDFTERDTSPINAPIAFGDNSTGCSLAAGVCAALFGKTRTGKGQKIMVSLLGQAIWNSACLVASTQFGDEYPKSRREPGVPLINSYRCKDGEWIFLAVLEHERYYNTLCKLFGRDDLVDDPRYNKTEKARKCAPEITAIFDKEFVKYNQDEIVEMLTKADIAHSRVKHVVDVTNDPQAIANKYVYEVGHANGMKTYTAAVPAKMGTIDVNYTMDAPALGEHSSEICKSLNYKNKEIQSFLDKKIIVQKSKPGKAA